ncbi:hypothetical protein GCM10010467_24500 [Actinocorallia glomerata]|uniref:Uncharacterized protein n=2 Tax=Actinomycetes TaxID=1760 RepID=A0ABP6LVI0_9MICC
MTTPGPSVPRSAKLSPAIGMTTHGRNAEMMSIRPPRIMAELPAWNTPQPVARPALIRAVMPPKMPLSDPPEPPAPAGEPVVLLPIAAPFAVVVMPRFYE